MTSQYKRSHGDSLCTRVPYWRFTSRNDTLISAVCCLDCVWNLFWCWITDARNIYVVKFGDVLTVLHRWAAGVIQWNENVQQALSNGHRWREHCPGCWIGELFVGISKWQPSKHTTSSQRREDVLPGRREDVLFAPTLGWKDVFWRRLEKTSSRRLVDVKAWRRIIVVFWLILCWKDVFATLYVRCL